MENNNANVSMLNVIKRKKPSSYATSDTTLTYIKMEEVTWRDYEEFIKDHSYVTIENTKLEIGKEWKIKEYRPKNFEPEATTVWSFPNRGNGLSGWQRIYSKGKRWN